MRRALDTLYNAAGYAAAFFMIGTLLMVVAGIADRMFGLNWRGTDMYAGYCMAAAGFLALAHTLKRGEHIRVMLVLQALPPKAKRMLELWSLFAASVLAGAGTLGLLIPPSIIMIVYGVTANVSIAQLFIAGVIPGIMLAALFSGYIVVWALAHSDAIPPASETFSFREKLHASRHLFVQLDADCRVDGIFYYPRLLSGWHLDGGVNDGRHFANH